MNLISRDELKQKLDDGYELKLVCALSDWAYRAMHIPGSIHVDNLDKAAAALDPEDVIVVYCTNVNCPASIGLYDQLVRNGYKHVQRYAGGLEEWEAAGYPLTKGQSATH